MRITAPIQDRLLDIESRRIAVLNEGVSPRPDNWLEQSWLRCMAMGHRPDQEAVFQPTSRTLSKRIAEEHHTLISASQPIMDQLAKSIANTEYFAVLTDKNGVVLNSSGVVSRNDRRASQITTLGIDLSESAIGTSAIGTALAEKKPVWLHQGEHFLTGNRIYSCAGAPIFDPQNQCIGMLDLTGIEVPERRELVHLAARSAKDIQNALLGREVAQNKGNRLLQLQWLGVPFDGISDGLISFDQDGHSIGFNQSALDWLPDLALQPNQNSEALFSLSSTDFFSALSSFKTTTLALWSGIRVYARWHPDTAAGGSSANLRCVEADLVNRAITSAKGNVAIAAQRLGISRATLYRKLQKGISQKP
jgi:sigma-54 dependent transcriptional regulator, acetoin dehydrogenase operon transcriptional activator AcoR